MNSAANQPQSKPRSGNSEKRFWIASPHAIWRTPLICLLAPGVFVVMLDWAVVSPWGFQWLIALWVVITVPSLMILPGLLVCPFYLLSRRRRRGALIGLIASAAGLSSLLAGMVAGEHIRHASFVRLAERSRPLVQAIQDYQNKNAKPPETLAALVPEFLPSIPKTGMGAYPTYDYHVGEAASRYDSNHWVLVVATPSGGINFDKFLYFPRQNYPKKGFGGWLQRIGDWAYVHE